MTCYIDPNHCLSWDALLPYVHPYVLGAPDEVILQAIRTSTIEFCRRSAILHDVNVLDIQKGVRDYPLETICDYEIVRIFQVSSRNKMIWQYSPSIMMTPSSNFGTDVMLGFGGYYGSWYYDGAGLGYTFYVQQPNLIILNVIPDKDDPKELVVEFIVQPKQDGCTLDNGLYEAWAEGIAYGAITRLLMMPNTSWFSMPTAKEYQIKYRNELARARTAVDLNFTSGPAMMRTVRWI